MLAINLTIAYSAVLACLLFQKDMVHVGHPVGASRRIRRSWKSCPAQEPQAWRAVVPACASGTSPRRLGASMRCTLHATSF